MSAALAGASQHFFAIAVCTIPCMTGQFLQNTASTSDSTLRFLVCMGLGFKPGPRRKPAKKTLQRMPELFGLCFRSAFVWIQIPSPIPVPNNKPTILEHDVFCCFCVLLSVWPKSCSLTVVPSSSVCLSVPWKRQIPSSVSLSFSFPFLLRFLQRSQHETVTQTERFQATATKTEPETPQDMESWCSIFYR